MQENYCQKNDFHSGKPRSLLCTYIYFWDLWSIQPQLWSVSQPQIFLLRALSSLSQRHLCCLYLLPKTSRLLTETPFAFQPSKPGTLQAAGGGNCPCEDVSWVPGPWPLDLFCYLFCLSVCLFSAEQIMHLSIFWLEEKKPPAAFKVVW